jgi:hypothetical protein
VNQVDAGHYLEEFAGHVRPGPDAGLSKDTELVS